MTPLTLFFYLCALAGGLVVNGLVLLALRAVYLLLFVSPNSPALRKDVND